MRTLLTVAALLTAAPALNAPALAQIPPSEPEVAAYGGLHAAAHLGHDDIVRTLIAAGAPLDHVNNLGWTALIESIVLGDGGKRHTATLDALVQAGADLNFADRQGVTPLGLAKGRGYNEMTRILEAAGAK